MRYSYPYRTIRRNTNESLDLSKAAIYCAEGVRSKRSWEPRGGKWKKANSFPAYNLSDVSNKDVIVKELANEYLLSNIDGNIKVPRRPAIDLYSNDDIKSEINSPSERQNPLQLVFLQEIINEATAQLSGEFAGKVEITPEIKAAFEVELKNQIENQVNNNVSIDHYTVLIETGLPVDTYLIDSWKTIIGKSITEFLSGNEPGLITGISGFILKGFTGETVTISDSSFNIAVRASVDNLAIVQAGIEIDKVAASWSRKVNSKLDLKISQFATSNSFYPLWVQYTKWKDLP